MDKNLFPDSAAPVEEIIIPAACCCLPDSGYCPLGASLILSSENELACLADVYNINFEANLAHCDSKGVHPWEQLAARAEGIITGDQRTLAMVQDG